MKKNFTIKIITAAVLLLLVTIFACKKNAEKDVCQTCTVSQDLEKIKISLGNYNSTFTHYLNSKVVPNSTNNYSLAHSDEKNQKGFYEILSFLGLPDKINENLIVGINIFVDKDAKDNLVIQLSEIKGVQIYLKYKMRMICYVYKNVNEKFEPVKELNATTVYLSTNDFHSLSNYFEPSSNRLCISVINPLNIPKTPFLHTSNFQRVLAQTLSAQRTESLIGAGGSNCDGPCGVYIPRYVCVEFESGSQTWHECKPNACGLTNDGNGVDDVVHTSYNYINFDSQNSNLTNFRDAFLDSSDKGDDYIDYYYYLSTQLLFTNSINLTYAYDAYTIINNDLEPIIGTLMTNPRSTNVLYNTDCKNRMLAFMDETRVLLTDSLSLVVVDSLKSDISHYANKSVVDILGDFK